MQNSNNTSFFYNTKIINIKSELLFREAEDDFFYFNHINLAEKKLKNAINLTPLHFKSIMLLANIYFIKGYTKKALNLYIQANNISKNNYTVLASIANCYSNLEENNNALKFCNKALDLLKNENFNLFSQLIEIKIQALINLKKYKQAFSTYMNAKNTLDIFSIKMINSLNYDKMKKHNKLYYSYLHIV